MDRTEANEWVDELIEAVVADCQGIPGMGLAPALRDRIVDAMVKGRNQANRQEATRLVHQLRETAWGDGLHHRDWNKFTIAHTEELIDALCVAGTSVKVVASNVQGSIVGLKITKLG